MPRPPLLTQQTFVNFSQNFDLVLVEFRTEN